MSNQPQHAARNAIHWFEIPVRDLPRAEATEEAVLHASFAEPA